MLPEPPAAILVVSAHWETKGFRITSGSRPTLIYDYYGFPPQTYSLRYDAPGAPDVARRAANLLREGELPVELDPEHGFDHGVFVPLMVAFPEAAIPIVEMSVEKGLDPKLHLAAGRALSGLRDEGVLILGSGMSFHNLEAFGDTQITSLSEAFDLWLTSVVMQPGHVRADRLAAWAEAPGSLAAHPTAEHLIPLMVAARASDTPGVKVYGECVLEAMVSGFRFD
jgi:aromatic ring-opening dioxygenase catalytic subunit (LigB family)